MKIYNAGSIAMNTYVYRTPGGYVMIDTGYAHRLKAVEKKLRRQGIALSEIRYVFLTHAHDDHAGFLNELLSKYPAIEVIVSEKALPVLRKGQNSFTGGCSGLTALAFCRLMALAGKGAHRFPAIEERHLDRFIPISPETQPRLEAALQGKILFTPGHTSDSISLVIGDIIFCGDAAMNGIPSLNRITIWIEDKTSFYHSWDILMAENASLLYPAHGKPFDSNDLKRYQNRISAVRLYPLADRSCRMK